MTKEESYHLTRFVTIFDLADTNADKFLPSSVYLAAKSNLQNSIANIKDLDKIQDKLKHDSVAPRKQARAACAPIFELANVIRSMALATNNLSLAANVKLTLTEFKSLPDSKLVTRLTTIINLGTEYLPELLTYGTTQEILTADTALLKAYDDEIQKQTRRNLDRKEVTKQIKKEFKVADTCLAPFDAMVEAKRLSDPVWYSLYQSALSIKYTPASRISAKAKVFDADTNQPLPGAMLSVSRIETNGKSLTSGPELVKIVKIKSAGGGIDLKSLTTGAYLFTVSYAGRADQQTTVYINEGVLTRVNFPLSKIA
jgi:hypothetical protein